MQISMLICKRERQLQLFFLSRSTYQYHNNSSQKRQNQNDDDSDASNGATLKALLVGISMPMLSQMLSYFYVCILLMSESLILIKPNINANTVQIHILLTIS